MSDARTWIVELPSYLPVINANRRMHFHRRAELTRNIRGTAFVCARHLKIPMLERAHIVCEFRPPDHRCRDVHNLYPTAKAAIDGLVDAGVLPDDSDKYLKGPDMRIGPVEPGGRIVLHVTELEVS